VGLFSEVAMRAIEFKRRNGNIEFTAFKRRCLIRDDICRDTNERLSLHRTDEVVFLLAINRQDYCLLLRMYSCFIPDAAVSVDRIALSCSGELFISDIRTCPQLKSLAHRWSPSHVIRRLLGSDCDR